MQIRNSRATQITLTLECYQIISHLLDGETIFILIIHEFSANFREIFAFPLILLSSLILTVFLYNFTLQFQYISILIRKKER